MTIGWIPQTPETVQETVQLNIESVSTDAYLDKYLFTDYPYQIQVEIANNGTNSLTSSFYVEFYLNDSLLARLPWLELAAESSVKINYTWTPSAAGLYNLRTKVVGNNIIVSNNNLSISLNVYDSSVNGYQGGLPFATYKTGIINGTTAFTTGNSTYKSGLKQNESYYVTFNLTELNLEGQIVLARLFVYYTWYYGANPQPYLKIQINDSPSTWRAFNLDTSYKDQKGFGSYSLPSGTLCYNVTSVVSSGTSLYLLNITNVDSTDHPTYGYRKVSIYGAGLFLVILNNSKPTIQYWINEGCDLLIAKYGAPANQPLYYPYATSTFSKPSLSGSIKNATLITVVPGGDGGHNSLIFNDVEWTGVYNVSGSNIAVDLSDVSAAISPTTNNIVKMVDYWEASNNGMTPSNAFLIVEY